LPLLSFFSRLAALACVLWLQILGKYLDGSPFYRCSRSIDSVEDVPGPSATIVIDNDFKQNITFLFDQFQAKYPIIKWRSLIQLSAWKSSLSEHFYRRLSDAREKSRRAFGWAEPLRAEMH